MSSECLCQLWWTMLSKCLHFYLEVYTFAHAEHGIHALYSAICKDWQVFVSGIDIVGLYVVAPGAASTSALPQLSRGADQFFAEKGEPGLHSSEG